MAGLYSSQQWSGAQWSERQWSGAGSADEAGGTAEILAKLDEIIATLAITDLWVKRIAVTTTGQVAGAGSGTEVFTVSALGITATASVDGNGNRTSVVWS